MWWKILMVMFGGAIGSALRYVLSESIQERTDSEFPFGTFAVNIIGCTIIGVLGALVKASVGPVGSGAEDIEMAGTSLLREELRLILMVGILGGFTTFSSFSLETFSLLENGQVAKAAGNVLASVGVGLLMVWLAFRGTEKVLELTGN